MSPRMNASWKNRAQSSLARVWSRRDCQLPCPTSYNIGRVILPPVQTCVLTYKLRWGPWVSEPPSLLFVVIVSREGGLATSVGGQSGKSGP